MTLVLTTHYMDEAEQLCDRLVIMDQGKIVAEGSPRQLIDKHVEREVVELRFVDGSRDGVEGKLEGLGARLEVLPDVQWRADRYSARACRWRAPGRRRWTAVRRPRRLVSASRRFRCFLPEND